MTVSGACREMAGLQYTREDRLEFPGGLGEPWGVATSSNGNTFVVDTEKGQVHMFSANRKYRNSLGSRGFAPGELHNPAGIASNNEGLLFVANNHNHCVEVFNEDEKTFVWRIGEGKLSNPWDVVTLGGSKIYVAEASKDRISVFSQDGDFSGTFGLEGQEPEKLAFPAGLAFSPNGYLYVTNSRSRNVHVFTANGRFVNTFGNGVLKYPIGIEISEGQVFVADCAGNCVTVFDKDGKHVHSYPSDNAHGVAVSPMGYLLVTGRSAKQVAVFS